jgi:tetratricopeptide (TPR) repeat protein
VSKRLLRLHFAIALCLLAAFGCVSTRPGSHVTKISLAELSSRVAEADRLASRGCYLCLKEAAAAYASLLELSDDVSVTRRALENQLMLALREVELRMPDSGARGAAERLQSRVPSSYAAYFTALDVLAAPVVTGGVTVQEVRARREARVALAAELQKEWPASAMKAYFYLATALTAYPSKELEPEIDGVVSTHSEDLSLEYRVQAFPPLFSEEASRALIGKETGFGEVHFLLGQRAVLDARLADAHRELNRARELLPDSAAITLALANVTFAYARYADALALFERVIAAGPDDLAALGRARALSYLRRHQDAIAALDDLLTDLRNSPGEKYYWRAWNRLQLGQAQPAYDDATAALNAMRNNDAYRLAGIASFNLNRISEARGYFVHALGMNRADCDSERYLGQIDAVERNWTGASGRFSQAVACYDMAIARMQRELAEYEKDISGLSNGLITSLRADIKDSDALRANSAASAQIALRNSQ